MEVIPSLVMDFILSCVIDTIPPFGSQDKPRAEPMTNDPNDGMTINDQLTPPPHTQSAAPAALPEEAQA